MKNTVIFALLLLALMVAPAAAQTPSEGTTFRPPSVPLVVHDPYFSIWSPADKLTDAETVHWTGKKHPLHAMVRIDGKPYRLMGTEPTDVPAMEQVKLQVTPTETQYHFQNDEVSVNLHFTCAMYPDNLDALSRPVTYVYCEIFSRDGKPHEGAFYFDAGAEIAVNTPDQQVEWGNLDIPEATTMKVGTVEQNILGKRGDDVRIDWGYFAMSVLNGGWIEKYSNLSMTVGNGEKLRNHFAKNGSILQDQTYVMPQSVEEGKCTIAAVWEAKEPLQLAMIPILLAYDDEYSIRYFGDDLRPWWKRDGKSFEEMLTGAWNMDGLSGRMELDDENQKISMPIFDYDFMEDLTAVGGEDYAKLCALAYRQSLGAQKLVADVNGMPLMISKENFSNGSAGTIDVMYPASPLMLYYSPALMKATLQPIFDYANTPKWKFPFAPHDLGTYPHATGQTYGGGERSEENQMPVEESANMILQTAALAVAENDPGFAKQHWGTLTKWADYLLDKGFDPENQLCTDDFAGHLAHNVNLSAKAIVAIGAYAQLADQLGEKETAAKYRKAAEEFAARWIKEADDGDHFRLAFDRPGTWSIKYNLMWDEILDLQLFPRSVIDKELAYYKTKMQKYGLPLDNRSLYSKNDWILWTATMTNSREDFDALLKPVIDFVNNTDRRVPLSDWYFTDSAKYRGFQARSVVGGYWAPMLKDTKKWQAQATKGANVPNTGWAEILLPGTVVGYIMPTSLGEKQQWQYSEQKPVDGWEQPDFNDNSWKTGPGGFGTQGTPGAVVGTQWRTNNIWLRRTFEWNGQLPEGTMPAFRIHHDEDVVVYVNGKVVLTRAGWTTNYETIAAPALLDVLKTGENTIAVHCVQHTGGQFIDVGIALMEQPKQRNTTKTISEGMSSFDGTAIFQGQPITDATVTFHSISSSDGYEVTATTDDEGKFKVQLRQGEYSVAFKKTDTLDGVTANLLPTKFANVNTTPFAVNVKPGKNECVFDLPH